MGAGGCGVGGGLYFKGRFNRGFAALSVCGAYTWRGMFSEFDSSTLIQYKNVILLLYLYILYLIRDSLICGTSRVRRLS